MPGRSIGVSLVEMILETVERYFTRVLGVHTVPFQAASGLENSSSLPSDASSTRAAILLLDVRDEDAVATASLEAMGARLLEALRFEWLKKSADFLPEFEWVRATPDEWRNAAVDGGRRTKLVIACGARDVHQTPPNVLHVPSLTEMQASPVIKREAWRMIQRRIAETD